MRLSHQLTPSSGGVRMRMIGTEPMWSPVPVCVTNAGSRETISRSQPAHSGLRTRSSSSASSNSPPATSTTSMPFSATIRSRSASDRRAGRTPTPPDRRGIAKSGGIALGDLLDGVARRPDLRVGRGRGGGRAVGPRRTPADARPRPPHLRAPPALMTPRLLWATFGRDMIFRCLLYLTPSS